MTRDEAMKIYQDASKPSGAHFLDGLAALGILKLDEPKHKIAEIRLLNALNWRVSEEQLCNALEGANLKLVEK